MISTKGKKKQQPSTKSSAATKKKKAPSKKKITIKINQNSSRSQVSISQSEDIQRFGAGKPKQSRSKSSKKKQVSFQVPNNDPSENQTDEEFNKQDLAKMPSMMQKMQKMEKLQKNQKLQEKSQAKQSTLSAFTKQLVNKYRPKLKTKYQKREVLVQNMIESLPYIRLNRWVACDIHGDPILQDMKINDDLVHFQPPKVEVNDQVKENDSDFENDILTDQEGACGNGENAGEKDFVGEKDFDDEAVLNGFNDQNYQRCVGLNQVQKLPQEIVDFYGEYISSSSQVSRPGSPATPKGGRKYAMQSSTIHQDQKTTPRMLVKDSGQKLFGCPHCDKQFVDNSKLRRHQLVHTGQKPFKCEVCRRAFSLDFNLKTHMRTHTGEKPYVCSHQNCFKRFTQSSNLSAHERTHQTNEKYMHAQISSSYNNSLQTFNVERSIAGAYRQRPDDLSQSQEPEVIKKSKSKESVNFCNNDASQDENIVDEFNEAIAEF